MRRVIALAAALGLVAALAAPTAAFPSPSQSSFVGSFDFYYNGTLAGHMNAQLWPSSADQPVSGSFSTSTSGFSTVALPRDVVFSHHDTYNEVWFNALEIGTGSYFAAFTGHFVDYFNPAVPDVVEFWGRHISPPTAPGAFEWSPSDNVPYYFQFTVGRGLYLLVVR